MLLAAFCSYHGFCNKESLTAADRPTKFVLVLGKIYSNYLQVRCTIVDGAILFRRDMAVASSLNRAVNHSSDSFAVINISLAEISPFVFLNMSLNNIYHLKLMHSVKVFSEV